MRQKRQTLNRGYISPASRNPEILEESIFSKISRFRASSRRDSTHRVLRKTNKQICQRPLVCAVSLLPHFLVLFFASESEARAKAERRQSEGTLGRRERNWPLSRPFPNAKIARINDMANFFEQKMSLFPLLKKRGSLWYQKRLSLVKRKGWLSR